MSDACIFCRIAGGQIPASKVYEDGRTCAFLDIHPIIQGHVLVIPREHVESLDAAAPESVHAVMDTVRKVVRAQRRSLAADGVNVLQNNGAASGQVVPHLHVHVIPRFDDDGHHWNWVTRSYQGEEEIEQTAAGLRQALRE